MHYKILNILLFVIVLITQSCQQQKKQIFKTVKTENMDTTNYNKLTAEEEYVILHKGTERPFTGELLDNKEKGTYICRRCNAPLYKSQDKFESHCGWPSFDDSIAGKVAYRKDESHGMIRVEIVCASCGGHLGHVFDDGPTETTGKRYWKTHFTTWLLLRRM